MDTAILDQQYLKLFGKSIRERRNELAKSRYGYKSYAKACRPRQETIDTLIDAEIRQQNGVGG